MDGSEPITRALKPPTKRQPSVGSSFKWLVVTTTLVAIEHTQQGRAQADLRSSMSCRDGMSTTAFRHMLRLLGIHLSASQHIDHVVPRALGGADHP